MTTTLQEHINDTIVDGEMTWKAYGQEESGRSHFITFGTPGTYSRNNVRAIAERLFDKTNLGVHLVAIRRSDVKRCPWVPAGQFSGKTRVSNKWGASQ